MNLKPIKRLELLATHKPADEADLSPHRAGHVSFFAHGATAWTTARPGQDTARHRGHGRPRGRAFGRHPQALRPGSRRVSRTADTARGALRAARTAHAAPRCPPAAGRPAGTLSAPQPPPAGYLSALIHQRDDKFAGRASVPSSQTAVRPHLRSSLSAR